MKLKMFEYFKSNQEIENICSEYGIENYTINSDGSVDVQGGVHLISYVVRANVRIVSGMPIYTRDMTKLPLEFGKVSGYFNCSSMGLTTLEGCPKEVGGNFRCSENKINTLYGCPKEVGGNFYCGYNPNLTSLEGLEDTIIRGYISAWYCKNLYCLDGFPIDFKGELICMSTPIEPIYDKYIKGSYIKGTNQLAQAIQFFNQLQVIEEGSFGWEISYRRLLEYLKRYKEFGKPTKEELQDLVGDKYIVR